MRERLEFSVWNFGLMPTGASRRYTGLLADAGYNTLGFPGGNGANSVADRLGWHSRR